MATKRSHIDIDPDYEDVTKAQTKRQKVLEDDGMVKELDDLFNINHISYGLNDTQGFLGYQAFFSVPVNIVILM